MTCAMSRMAQVIVLARSSAGGTSSSTGSSRRRGVLAGLEAWPWNNPERVQVMLHGEDDDCSARVIAPAWAGTRRSRVR